MPVGRRSVWRMTTIGILALVTLAIAAPRWSRPDHSSEGMHAALREVRGAIEAFRRERREAGSERYPTLIELQTPGVVLAEALPRNPLNQESAVLQASWDDELSASFPEADAGWCYDERTGRFWSATTARGSHRW
jgi:hypothetical protein